MEDYQEELFSDPLIAMWDEQWQFERWLRSVEPDAEKQFLKDLGEN